MSKTRTRHPDESSLHKGAKKNEKGIYEAHIDARGRTYNGKSNKPLKYDSVSGRYENLREPSDKMLAVIGSGVILRPQQIAAVRQGITNIVHDNLKKAAAVLEGAEKWNSSQTRLFLGLLDKVAPRMSDTMHRSTMQPQTGADYSKMSRADLEAALAEVMADTTIIDVTPEPEPEPAPEPTPPMLTEAEVEASKGLRRRREGRHKNSLAEVRARHLEKGPTILPLLTREQDDKNRRQAKQSARGLRKRASENATMADLAAMASMDPIILGMATDPAQAAKLDPRSVAERFLKTPPVDRPAEPE